MKKAVVVLVLVLLLTLAFSSIAFAAPGGMPAAHGVDGMTFGGLVSEAAQMDTFWLVEHVSGHP